MPGMHQRFIVIEAAVRGLDKQVQVGFTDMGKLVNDGFVAITQQSRERDSKLAAAYVAMAASLGSLPANTCLLYTSPSPRDLSTSRMPSSA